MVAQKSLTEFQLDQEVVLSACLFVLHKEGQKKEHNEKEPLHAENMSWDEEIEAAEVSGVKSESIQFNRPQILDKIGKIKINFKYTCKFINI